MRSPKTGKPMHQVEGAVNTHLLRGVEFRLSSPVWECADTGEHYFTPEQGNVFLARLHHAWRKQQGIAPADLQQRSAVLGLSDAQVSVLLGFGPNQYTTYKTTDKLPSKSNAKLLRLFCDDQALPALLQDAANDLSRPARRKLQAYLDHLRLRALVTAQVTDTTLGGAELYAGAGPPRVPTTGPVALAGNYSYAMAA